MCKGESWGGLTVGGWWVGERVVLKRGTKRWVCLEWMHIFQESDPGGTTHWPGRPTINEKLKANRC